jgi:uncharacterized membrane protein
MTAALALALPMGVVAGLRTMTPLAAIGWAAHLGWLDLSGTWLAFLGHPAAPWILTALALGEFVTDQLPSTPSRKVPVQFGGRLASGALCGWCLGLSSGAAWPGLVAGVVGAAVGTLGGAALRARLAASFGRDLPAALIEDGVAVLGAMLIVASAA